MAPAAAGLLSPHLSVFSPTDNSQLCARVIPSYVLLWLRSGIRIPNLRHRLEIPTLQMYYHVIAKELGQSSNASFALHSRMHVNFRSPSCHRQRTGTCLLFALHF